MNDIALVQLTTTRALYAAPYQASKTDGALILIDPHTFRTVAAGMVVERSDGAATTDGGLRLVAHLASPPPPGAEGPPRLQIPLAMLAANEQPVQERLLELLLELGWSVDLEAGPGASALQASLARRGFRSEDFEHGLGL